MTHNLDTPEGRFAATQALGPDGYNRAMEEKFARDTVKVVCGHAIRKVVSQRFGTIYMVDGLGCGWNTIDKAEAAARANPAREAGR